MIVFEFLERAIIRLWPLWVLLLVYSGWRLWFVRVRAEGEDAVTPRSRRRWQLGFWIAGMLLLLCYADVLFQGRPHQGTYHPSTVQPDGSMAPAYLEPKGN